MQNILFGLYVVRTIKLAKAFYKKQLAKKQAKRGGKTTVFIV